tara:strand:- start:222 stop:668 length:447 start_codon:yes stop_codon:yes gene_type:complete
MKLLLINGPNLNLLGLREPEIYGSKTLASIEKSLHEKSKEIGVKLDCFQSNCEGDIVDKIHDSIEQIDGILINAGALTHTSISIRDALVATSIPYVELHLSNTHAREGFREKSFLAYHAVGIVSGFGDKSYDLAMDGLVNYLEPLIAK